MSISDEARSTEQDMLEMAAARARIRRRRSVALALSLLVFALTFYVLTIVKMGPALFDRAL